LPVQQEGMTDRKNDSTSPHTNKRPVYQHAASSGPPPPLYHLSNWFDYYDVDHSGKLDCEELVNALLSTYQRNDIESMRETVYSILPVFDPNGDGLIDREEFIASEGLGESLLSALQNIQVTIYGELDKKQQLVEPKNVTEQGQDCVVCQEETAEQAIVPCGHQCLCVACATKIMNSDSKRCPFCRTDIERILKIYRQF